MKNNTLGDEHHELLRAQFLELVEVVLLFGHLTCRFHFLSHRGLCRNSDTRRVALWPRADAGVDHVERDEASNTPIKAASHTACTRAYRCRTCSGQTSAAAAQLGQRRHLRHLARASGVCHPSRLLSVLRPRGRLLCHAYSLHGRSRSFHINEHIDSPLLVAGTSNAPLAGGGRAC